MGKKILLINPSCDKAGTGVSQEIPPLGLGYLASYLKKYSKQNHKVKILDANLLRVSNESILKSMEKSMPDIVGIHLNVESALNGIPLGREVKKRYPEVTVVFGGPMSSDVPMLVMQENACDINVIGEGEETFKEICDGRKLEEIKGIAYFSGGEIKVNEKRELIENLDDIPFPAYELMPGLKHYRGVKQMRPFGPVMLSRGCPYSCTFCSKNAFGHKLRYHSKEYALRHLRFLMNHLHVSQICLLDENFTGNINRAEEIFDEIIKQKMTLPNCVISHIRADAVNERLVQKMKKIGVVHVGIGIESGDPGILKDVNKSLDLKKVISTIKLLRKYKIRTLGYLVAGFPNETKKSMKKTTDFIIRANPTWIVISHLRPLPGTEIYSYLQENNKLIFHKGSGYSFYLDNQSYKANYLTQEKIEKLSDEMFRRFYFRPAKIIEVLSTIRSFADINWFFSGLFQRIKKIFNKT